MKLLKVARGPRGCHVTPATLCGSFVCSPTDLATVLAAAKDGGIYTVYIDQRPAHDWESWTFQEDNDLSVFLPPELQEEIEKKSEFARPTGREHLPQAQRRKPLTGHFA